jgi:hypothetical protein
MVGILKNVMPAPASVLFSEMLTFVFYFSLCYLLDITEKNKNEILPVLYAW